LQTPILKGKSGLHDNYKFSPVITTLALTDCHPLMM
jgi:hypothetical protein